MVVAWRNWLWPIVSAALASSIVSAGVSTDPPVARSDGLASRKGHGASIATISPIRATFAQTHTSERVILDDTSPPAARFDALLADRTTGESHTLDPRLEDLLRTLTAKYQDGGPPRVELVSGFRSAKLNEMLRKKGHHVASHSQHTLGHAVDFRIVPAGADKGVDPRELERAIRDAGWDGGVGVYLGEDDWFVHADVGPRRAWKG